MIITDNTLNRIISDKLIAEREKREKKYTPSGKLSASQLGKPLQWQVLKTIGVPQKEIDEYVLRKFQRGNHVEDYIISHLPEVLETQKEVYYRDVIGFVDALVDTDKYECKRGVMPNEVKSVTNASFNWINKDRQPKYGHSLQGALYALALKSKYFMITYVASDDYRIWSVVQETSKYKADIDKIVDNYNGAIKNQVVPEFVPVEEWQRKKEYADYPDFMDLTQEQINEKLKEYEVKWTTDK